MGTELNMKNIINEKPTEKLNGRLQLSTEFVNRGDIRKKIVLDVGCGYGWFEHFALKNGVKKIIGLEISENDLLTVNSFIKSERFEAKIGTAVEISSKDGLFDTVVAWEVIEHIPRNSENKMFKEIHRVLKKNGTFYLSTPNSSILSKYLDPAFWLIGHRHYNAQKLIEYGLQNKFALEKLEIVGGIWTSLLIINMYISKWIFKKERFFYNYFNKKVEKEYKHPGFYNIFMKFRKI